jgi:Glycosyltransferase
MGIMTPTKKVLFITEGKFPNGDAGSIRFYYLSKAFSDLGYSVDLLTQGYSPYGVFTSFDFGRFASLRIQSKISIYGKARNHIGMARRYFHFYQQHCQDYSVLVFGGVLSRTLLKKYVSLAHRHNALLVFSLVEWFSPSEFALGSASLTYRKRDSFIRQITKEDGKVIAISSFLTRYFADKGVDSVTIPFVMSKDTVLGPSKIQSDVRSSDRQRNFYYAGDPAKKDLLEKMVVGFSLLSKEDLDQSRLHIFGIGEDFFSKNTRGIIDKKLQGHIVFHGRTKREELLNQVSSFDFSILLRDENERFAKAGFPTKITESLFLGIPPVTNLTSDLGLYLKDGENAIIARNSDSKAFSEALHRAIGLSDFSLSLLKANAKATAHKELAVENFEKELGDLLSA